MFINKISRLAALSILANIILAIILFIRPSIPNLPQPTPANPDINQTKIQDYPFLSKRIFAENQNDLLLNFIPLRTALHEYVDGLPEQVGVYFEYLPSGVSIGVNDSMEINIASLLKIPVVMGVYRDIEKGKTKKDDLLVITENNIDKKFGDLWKKGVGTTLTVEEAIGYSLKKSDNTAAKMLLHTLSPEAIDNVFDSLDIPKDTNGKLHIISPKNYASILRSLYLSSYLTKESSSEILDILTKTDFDDKIANGMPSTVKIAHKIGVFNSLSVDEEMYSDCGIVYVPNRPYLLCVMTRSNEEKAREHMAHVSKMIYGYITAVQSKK